MKRKKSKPCPAPQACQPFSLHDLCGKWKSLCGSPGIHIYHDGRRFRLELVYRHDAAFTVPLQHSRGITFFDFYGRIQVAYDSERDLLLLTTEGLYHRVYD